MFFRHAELLARAALGLQPAVCLIGPRQVGKTTLARWLATQQPSAIVFDLENASHRRQLREPELVLPGLRDRLVVIDEIQLLPDLFMALRPEIDAHRVPGRFLLLGSATGDLLRQSGESLAGRISNIELTPLTASDLRLGTDLAGLQRLWWRGGFPLSWSAGSDAASFHWRDSYIDTLLHRDLPAMGVRIPAETLRRFWGMLAHLQGQVFNASQLGQALGGMSHATVGRYLDLMVDALLVRRLRPYLANVGKRLVKSPKVYVRDSGLLHALLGAADPVRLQSLPQAGASWEGFVIEQIVSSMPRQVAPYHYRTAAGAEVDLVLEAHGRRVAVEVKLSAAPEVTKGFWQSVKDLQVEQAFVVAAVTEAYPIGRGVTVIPVAEVGRVGQALGVQTLGTGSAEEERLRYAVQGHSAGA